jgi:hypothetical protein
MILRDYPEMGENIGENSGIMKNPEFESAVIFSVNEKLHWTLKIRRQLNASKS